MKRKRMTAADEEFTRRALENAQRLREFALANQRRHDEANGTTTDAALDRSPLENAQHLRELALANQRRHDEAKKSA